MRAAPAAVLVAAAALPLVYAQGLTRDRPPLPVPTGAIRGRVVSSERGEPVRKARIDLVGGTGDRLDPVYSDSEGRFAFPAVIAGRYSIGAWKSGYAPATFGARTPWEPAIMLAVEAGQVVEPVEIRLARGGSISGRVLDDAGEPLSEMQVTVGRAAPLNGRLQFQSIGSTATTDDRGEYRIGGLPSGTYVVNTFGRAGSSVFGTSTFYQQTPFLGQARTVAVRAGEELTSVDVVYTPELMVTPTVSGRVVDPRGPVVQAGISAASNADGVGPATRSLGAPVQPNGEFKMNLPPGDYILTAQTGEMIAQMPITVDRVDVSGLELVLVKSARVMGRLIFDGTSPRPAGGAVVAVGPDGRPEFFGGRQAAPVRSNGAFVLSNLIGACELGVTSLRGWHVKSIRAAGRDLLDVPIEFKGGEELRNVEIVLTDATAQLAGVITGVEPSAAAGRGISVLVFPADRGQGTRRAQWIRPDQTGRFVAADLTPGTYLVALATDVDDLLWQTSGYLDRFRSTAQRVTLRDGEHQSITFEWTEPR